MEEMMGQVPVTEVTPPAEVVVAMILPAGSTARIVPAGVARGVSVRVLFIVEDAVEKNPLRKPSVVEVAL